MVLIPLRMNRDRRAQDRRKSLRQSTGNIGIRERRREDNRRRITRRREKELFKGANLNLNQTEGVSEAN
jgi:hypothetical protein